MTGYFGTQETLKISKANNTFKVGDYVEYQNDGVLRQVTGVNPDNITINPPLPLDNVGSYWGRYLLYWGNNSNVQEDFRPKNGPACTGSDTGSYIGALPCSETNSGGSSSGGGSGSSSYVASQASIKPTILASISSFFKEIFSIGKGKDISQISGNAVNIPPANEYVLKIKRTEIEQNII
jgi:hypothetical protein